MWKCYGTFSASFPNAPPIVEWINARSNCRLFLWETKESLSPEGEFEIQFGYPVGDEGNQSWYRASLFNFLDEDVNAEVTLTPLVLDDVCERS